MKKFLPLTLFLLICSSLFFHFVYADTSFTLAEPQFANLSYLPDIISLADDYLDTQFPNSTTKEYIIFQKKNYQGLTIYVWFTTTGGATPFYVNAPSNPTKVIISSSNTNGTYRKKYDISTNTLINDTGADSSYTVYLYEEPNTAYALLYSSNCVGMGWHNQELNYTYNFTYGSDIYSITSDGSNCFPTIKDLNDIWFSTPPDDTPLLTSFINVVLEKLALLCEFITSSYIYLSVIAVFILYFVIYLFRRFV